MNSFNLELQLKDTEFATRNKLIYLLTELKGFKFATTLVLDFNKIENDDKTKYITFYLNSKAEPVIDGSDNNDAFDSIYSTITSNIEKSLGSGWVIDLVLDYNINILKYNPLAGSSYIRLAKELNHPKKGLTNIQNIDRNECFKWCLVKYLHPADHHLSEIRKGGRLFGD